jgi:hypothetical protein
LPGHEKNRRSIRGTAAERIHGSNYFHVI